MVAGALAAKAANGGHAWSRISVVLGLRRLGWEVAFVEQLDGVGQAERDYFDGICEQFGIDGHLFGGPAPPNLVERVQASALLINFGGHLTSRELKRGPGVKVFLDDDPGYTQLWHASGLLDGKLDEHDFYFTFGENVGRPGCTLPVNGIRWRHVRPPVVLDEWAPGEWPHEGFRTVASWRGGYGRVEFGGHLYGQKAHEFRRFVDLPQKADADFEIALRIDADDSADLALLRSHGWQLVDPRQVAGSPDDFRRYVHGSAGEFSVAQGIYVETQCGWFSDRTTRFLASGRPALVQDTGFSKNLPTGDGLIAFTTLEEAVAGAEAIGRDYHAHAHAAREIAKEYFASDRVLGRLLEEVGL